MRRKYTEHQKSIFCERMFEWLLLLMLGVGIYLLCSLSIPTWIVPLFWVGGPVAILGNIYFIIRTLQTMTNRVWHVKGLADEHTLHVEHSLGSGRVVISIDEEVLFQRRRKILDCGLEKRFTIDGVECLLKITPGLWRDSRYRLWCDGIEQEHNPASEEPE